MRKIFFLMAFLLLICTTVLAQMDQRKTAFHDVINFSGAVTRIQYPIPKDNNPYFVFKNYENALIKGNHQILFSGSGKVELGLDSYDWTWHYFGREEGINPLQGEPISPRGNNYC